MRGEIPPGNGAGPLDLGTSSGSSSDSSSGSGLVSEAVVVAGFDEGMTSWRWSWSRLVSTVQLRCCRAFINSGYGSS